jgi:hypothetical protein
MSELFHRRDDFGAFPRELAATLAGYGEWLAPSERATVLSVFARWRDELDFSSKLREEFHNSRAWENVHDALDRAYDATDTGDVAEIRFRARRLEALIRAERQWAKEDRAPPREDEIQMLDWLIEQGRKRPRS